MPEVRAGSVGQLSELPAVRTHGKDVAAVRATAEAIAVAVEYDPARDGVLVDLGVGAAWGRSEVAAARRVAGALVEAGELA
jgi:hypothetical protein